MRPHFPMSLQRSRSRLIRCLKFNLSLLLILPLQAQEKYAYDPLQIDTLIVAQERFSHFTFPERHRVMDQSIQIRKNKRLLRSLFDYRYNNAENRIEFFIPVDIGDSLHIHYQIQPILLRKTYRFFEKILRIFPIFCIFFLKF